MDIATRFKALYPEELIDRYRKGQRDFVGINLLRAELEHIYSIRQRQPMEIDLLQIETSQIPKWYTPFFDTAVNPLWADYRTYENEFEWDSFGAFIPTEYDDILPPRDLTGLDLSGINLAGAYLYPVNLSGTNLTGAVLRKAKLFDANMEGAILRYADIRRTNLSGSNLEGADLYMARLQRAVLTSANLKHANLGRAKLRNTFIISSDLRGACLAATHFERTWLNDSDMRNTDLSNIELPDCVVTDITISHMQQADFLAALRIRLQPA